jgi:hypothetical protein
LKAREREIMDRVNDLDAKIHDIKLPDLPDFSKTAAEVEKWAAELERAESDPWNEVAKIGRELVEMGGVKKSLKNFGEILLSLSTKHAAADPAYTRKVHAVAIAEHEKAIHARMDAEKALAEAKAERDRLEAERKSAQGAYRDIEKEIEKDLESRMDQYKAKRQELIRVRDAVARSLLALNGSRQEADACISALKQAEDHLEEIKSNPAPKPPVADGELEAKLHEVKLTIEKVATSAAVRGELSAIVVELEALDAKRAVFAALEFALQRAREREITEAGGPLLGKMNEFMKGAKRKEAPYFRAGKGVCEIGWKREDGTEVEISALSGGEYCLFATALTAAVIIMRGATLRFLLVEAAEADDTTFHQLLGGIETVAHDLSCAIVSTRTRGVVVDKSWTVHAPETEAVLS